jgi:hypothetical protein
MREGVQVMKYNNEINLKNLWGIKDDKPYRFGNDTIGIGVELVSGIIFLFIGRQKLQVLVYLP